MDTNHSFRVTVHDMIFIGFRTRKENMTAGNLKEVLQDVPDDWIVVVEQPEGDRYHTKGARGDEKKSELIIEL